MTTKLFSLLVTVLLVCNGVEAVTCSLVETEIAVRREVAPGEWERRFDIVLMAGEKPASGTLVLRYVDAGKLRERELLPLYGIQSHDTMWVTEPLSESIQYEILNHEVILTSGSLDCFIPEQTTDISYSQPITRDDLSPLCLRGTNYFPRTHPWPYMWTKMTEEMFDKEFQEMAQLNINTLRTFYILDEPDSLIFEDGSITPLYVSRVNKFLRVADKHEIKVQLCCNGGGGKPESDINYWRRFYRTAVEPFAYDGRILMWDLTNEPGGAQGPASTPELARWLQINWAELQELAPNHLLTVGLTWQFDQLWSLDIIPDVAHYHNYSRAVGIQPEDEPPVRNVADDLREIKEFVGENRPLIIGEFGYASYDDGGFPLASEEYQAQITEWVLQGAETVGIEGVYNWCAFVYEPEWMGLGEQSFGVIRLDGTLKPAGIVLRDTYDRWREKNRAPWEVE